MHIYGFFGKSMMSIGRLEALLPPRGCMVRMIGFCPAMLCPTESSIGRGMRSSPTVAERVADTLVYDTEGGRTVDGEDAGGAVPRVEVPR